MQELGSLIQDLPWWAQGLIVLVVIGIGAVFGVRIPKRGDSGFRHKTATLRRASGSRPRISHADEPSPGQAGRGATSDLPQSVIREIEMTYAPASDGTPDPGEVVWTWVPFVEYDGRGKDRPVLVIGRVDANSVAGCYLSTKPHRGFIEVGAGPWDTKGRISYLNPDRVLRITDEGMRREGAVMGREKFEEVSRELTQRFIDRSS